MFAILPSFTNFVVFWHKIFDPSVMLFKFSEIHHVQSEAVKHNKFQKA